MIPLGSLVNAAGGALQLRARSADGAVDRSERMLLESLRARLAISAEDALRVEREVAP